MNKNDNWYGTLSKENVEDVATRIERLLKGKKYTFVAVNEFFSYCPETRVHETLNHVTVHRYDELGWVIVSDSYGVWSFTYNNDTPRENPYIVIEYGNHMLITHHAPSGKRLYWEITVE